MNLRSLHYAWTIVLAGAMTLFCCMGLARFALGMLLPSMGENLDLSYTQMGFISTGNFIGYLLSVFLCGKMISRLGERNTIVTGLGLIAASMLCVSFSSQLWLIILMYFITGIGSGAANITSMTLIAHWFSKKYRGRSAGYMIFGNGLGIVASGLLVPWLNSQWAETGWRIGWGTFALATALLTVAVAMLIQNNPAQTGLRPYGESEHSPPPVTTSASPDNRFRLISHIGAIYFMFGFTYVIYTTFIVTSLIADYEFSESFAGALWMGIGVISMFSGALFGWVSDHFGRKTGLVVVFALQTLAYLLVATELGEAALYVSLLLFGMTAFSIPAIIAALVSDTLPPAEAGKVFGYITFFFGIGQIFGPTLAGYLAEQSQSFSSSYLLAASLTSMGIGLTLLLKASPKEVQSG
ncbi:MFS transporter [Neptuniibacter halophilus]|uniref:MFS transporter n=1 Tax=Neptuniibacter halophilus TaxID=651666 RepID=UPI00257476CA|nr:MFS transporter [Neptuniibacter halophilus]